MFMKEGFTRKKVESLTLGEKLKKLRNDFRTSLPEVSRATKIQVKYLEFLENGEYDKLPADVYVRGFLRSYARYLNVNEQIFINAYERERHIQKNLHQEAKSKKNKKNAIQLTALVITPKAMIMSVIFLFVIFSFFYLFRELESFAGVPRLVITMPRNGEKIPASEIVVQGKTDKGARISINGQSVFVDNEGGFSDTVILQRGFNTMIVTAINRFDKEKKETLIIESDIPMDETKLPETEPFSEKINDNNVKE